MVEITLLGRVAVQIDGQTVSGEAAQRRRLALLALIADPPLRPISRDRLMLHLWPENGTDSARHLLSAALHVLRKALGPDVLLSSAEHVELSADRVRIDVAEFENAADGDDPEHALSLYGGPFLDGLFLSGSPEFEQWRDGRRAELAGVYARVLERAAETRAAAGRLDAAVEAWRRLAAHDPFSSRAVLGLMRALAAAGNRAGALQAARVHEQLLDSEFGAIPDPAVVKLAEELRREPVATGAATTPALAGAPAASESVDAVETAVTAPPTPVPQSTRQAPLAGRTRRLAALLALGIGGALFAWLGTRTPGPEVIAVVPRAGPGADSAADYLSYGIAETVDYELGRLGGLRVLNTGSSFLYRDSVLDPREIGRRLSADLLVTVSARMTAGAPRVRIELLRASDGQRIWEEQYDGAAVHGASNDAVAGIGGALQLGPPVVSAPGHRAATTSTEAYTLYQQGRYAWSRRTPESLLQAVDLLQRASDADPSYPWPHVGLADAYNMLGSYDYGVLPPDSAYPMARRAARRALALAPDLAPAHAALANVQVNHDWDWHGAETGFRRAIALNAGYTPASEWLANLMIARGRMPEALALLRGALEYNPASALTYTGLAHYHYYAREYDQSHAYLDRAMEIDPSFGRTHLVRALVFCMEGSYDAPIRILEPMAATNRTTDPIVVALLGYAYARSGRITEARAEVDWLRTLAASRFVPAEYEAIILVGLGDEQRALDLFEVALARRSSAMIYLGVDPLVDPLRGMPRFQRILAAVSSRP